MCEYLCTSFKQALSWFENMPATFSKNPSLILDFKSKIKDLALQ